MYPLASPRFPALPERYLLSAAEELAEAEIGKARVGRRKPMMEEDEISALFLLMKSARTYFEFGTGGSLFLAAEAGVDESMSVDNAMRWVRTVREAAIVRRRLGSRARFVYVDTGGAASNLGRPRRNLGSSQREYFMRERYPLYPLSLSLAPFVPDLILVDGRFRVACALRALFSIPRTTLLIIHDYHRTGYHHVELFYDRLFQVRRLAVFRPKIVYDARLAFAMYGKFHQVYE
jgi:hypothetical protein